MTLDHPAAPDLTGRIALVTGASRGIGRALALQLAKAGSHVIAVARTTGGLEELDDEIRASGGEATLVPLDLADLTGIDRLGGVIAERWGHLDILVANAAILGPITPVGHIRAKEFDEVMALNVTATWRLIRSTDPLLRQSTAGRAIVLTSSVAQRPRAFWGAYAASKAAVEAITFAWAAEAATTSMRINLADPGATRTRMRAQAMPGENPQTLPTPDDVAAALLPMAAPDLAHTGLIYDVRKRAWMAPQAPVPADV